MVLRRLDQGWSFRNGNGRWRSFFFFYQKREREIFSVIVFFFSSSKILKMQTTTPGLSRAVHYAAQYCNEIISRLFISYWQQNVIYRKSWHITVCVLVLFWLSNDEMEEEEWLVTTTTGQLNIEKEVHVVYSPVLPTAVTLFSVYKLCTRYNKWSPHWTICILSLAPCTIHGRLQGKGEQQDWN